MDDAAVENAVASVGEANDNKQREVLDSLIGIRIEAEAMPDRTKAVDHAISETARVYEDAFVLEVSAEGCATEFMGAADRYLEQVNS
uniref:Uncharacterized protein n=1 Tax=Pseudomonas phage RVTF4 TaxID=3236931 RepID=A0AB39CCF0_9VIRU